MEVRGFLSRYFRCLERLHPDHYLNYYSMTNWVPWVWVAGKFLTGIMLLQWLHRLANSVAADSRSTTPKDISS